MRHVIIGIIVWVGIGIIILPFILDGEGVEQLESQQSPPRAEITDLNLQPIEADVFQEAIAITSAPVAVPAPAPAPAPAPETSAPDTDNNQDSDTKNTRDAVMSNSMPTSVDKQVEQADKPSSSANQSELMDTMPSLKSGWTIQLGSFKNQKNAVALKQKIGTAGYPAFAHTQGDYVQVHVGPFATRKQAEVLKKQIESSHRINGIIVSYKGS